MLSISELRPIPGRQHWEAIVLVRTDSQGILGLLALGGKQCVIHDKLKNWTTPSRLPDRAGAGLATVVLTCLLALKPMFICAKKKYFQLNHL